MQYQKESPLIRKLWLGLRVRCPNCEEGTMFKDLFHIHETCPVCDVRFERRAGESTGGMMFTLGFAEVFSVGGFFLSQALFDPPLLTQLIFWGAFTILFCLSFYRNGRGLWVSIVYLTGGIYKDGEEPEKAKPRDWTQL